MLLSREIDCATHAAVLREREERAESMLRVTHERERVRDREPAPYPRECARDAVLNLFRDREGGIHVRVPVSDRLKYLRESEL